ncbi:hypothetical protein BS78_06G265700 [Paspalum vaginatum]|nr:hypothetical protein BS78_06G265700 [Paspalum vaginatum]
MRGLPAGAGHGGDWRRRRYRALRLRFPAVSSGSGGCLDASSPLPKAQARPADKTRFTDMAQRTRGAFRWELVRIACDLCVTKPRGALHATSCGQRNTAMHRPLGPGIHQGQGFNPNASNPATEEPIPWSECFRRPTCSASALVSSGKWVSSKDAMRAYVGLADDNHGSNLTA